MKKIFLLVTALLFIQKINAQVPCPIVPGYEHYFTYEINFENDSIPAFDSVFSIDTIVGDLWQIGTTTKTFANNTDTIRALMTDTVNAYKDSADVWFVLKIGNENFEIYNPYIEIIHQYNTDSLLDGCIIEYSCDTMQTWHNLVEDGCYFDDTFNYSYEPTIAGRNVYAKYDTLNDGIPAFSGNSNGWIHTYIQYYWGMPVKITPTECNNCIHQNFHYLRFRFKSDGTNTGKDGWIIKKLILYQDNYWGGINDFNKKSLAIYPNPSNDGIVHFPDLKLIRQPTIQLYDVLGKKVFEGTYQQRMDFSALNNGMYLYQIITDDTHYSGRIIIRQ